MSRGLETRTAELARLYLSVRRIGRCGATVVVNPVSCPRSALAANRGLGQPSRPSRLLHVPTLGPSKLRDVSSLAESRRQETEAAAQCTPEAASPSSTFIFESSTSSGILVSRGHELCLLDPSYRGHRSAGVGQCCHIKAQPFCPGRYHFALALANLTHTTTHLIGPTLTSE